MSERPPSGATRSLDELLAQAWTGLSRAVRDAKHEWHLPVVTTLGLDGGPQSRTVVLRAADMAADDGPMLRFHTDRRSGKIEEIARDPRISVLVYERRHKVQLRMTGQATVHVDDAVAEDAWARTAVSSRRCYLAPHAPSRITDDWHPNLPEDWRHAVPDEATCEGGRVNFAAVVVRVESLERLELHHDGHVRSRWRWNGERVVESVWLAP
jgi:hypothetical protein